MDLLRLCKELERQAAETVQESWCVSPLHGLLVTAAIVHVLTNEHNQVLQQLRLINSMMRVVRVVSVVICCTVVQQVIDDVIELDLIVVWTQQALRHRKLETLFDTCQRCAKAYNVPECSSNWVRQREWELWCTWTWSYIQCRGSFFWQFCSCVEVRLAIGSMPWAE